MIVLPYSLIIEATIDLKFMRVYGFAPQVTAEEKCDVGGRFHSLL
jgi:hypothetical protein